MKAVQRMLGNASPAMLLDTYADLFEGDRDSVAERMGATSPDAPQVRPKGLIVHLSSIGAGSSQASAGLEAVVAALDTHPSPEQCRVPDPSGAPEPPGMLRLGRPNRGRKVTRGSNGRVTLGTAVVG